MNHSSHFPSECSIMCGTRELDSPVCNFNPDKLILIRHPSCNITYLVWHTTDSRVKSQCEIRSNNFGGTFQLKKKVKFRHWFSIEFNFTIRSKNWAFKYIIENSCDAALPLSCYILIRRLKLNFCTPYQQRVKQNSS